MVHSDYDQSWTHASTFRDILSACQTGMATLTRYSNAFFIPFMISASYFNRVESQRFWGRDPLENLSAYLKLGQMNLELTSRALSGGFQAANHFIESELNAFIPNLSTKGPNACADFARRLDCMIKGVAYAYPAAIENIEGEFGFHFERQPPDSKVDETDRFELFQVLPSDPKCKVRKDGKPLLIIPPFVLGANILGFLPGEERSYGHAFANQGIPTYVRVLKNIQTAPAVQMMTPEDDAKDTQRFCHVLQKRHQRAVTLNGYCQGGFSALCNLLSGELDDLVDAFITCVAPMDGTRGKGLTKFLKDLPTIFNDISYGTKRLPNGNSVADGTLMGWVYKLKSIEAETPLLAMWRDMMLVAGTNGRSPAISKTAAALNHWLLYERNDLPIAITRMSFASYNTPIASDGTLPVRLFGRDLNLKRLQAKKIKWLICYGLQDDLVEPETALAPLDFVEAEVTPFPKGHVAIATSWSYPKSAYALYQQYEKENTRGPVRFQLDLQAALDAENKVTTHQLTVVSSTPEVSSKKEFTTKQKRTAKSKTTKTSKTKKAETASQPIEAEASEPTTTTKTTEEASHTPVSPKASQVHETAAIKPAEPQPKMPERIKKETDTTKGEGP